MSVRPLALAAALAVSCSATFAQNKDFYVGATVGQSKASNPKCPEFLIAVASCSSDSTDIGWKVFAGYQFSKFFAGEISYADLGKLKILGTGNSTISPALAAEVREDFRATGFSADAVGTLPLKNGFGLLGRVGAFWWNLAASGKVSTPPGSPPIFSSTDRASGAGLDYGVGVKWDFNPTAGARVEFQRFAKIGNDNTVRSDVDLLSASILFRF